LDLFERDYGEGNTMASTIRPTPTICPISGAPAMQLPSIGDRREIISSSGGGRYAISDTANVELRRHPLDDQERELLVGWIAEQHRSGEACPVVWSYVLGVVLGKRR
jgi:hypothetical protein